MFLSLYKLFCLFLDIRFYCFSVKFISSQPSFYLSPQSNSKFLFYVKLFYIFSVLFLVTFDRILRVLYILSLQLILLSGLCIFFNLYAWMKLPSHWGSQPSRWLQSLQSILSFFQFFLFYLSWDLVIITIAHFALH